MDTVIQTQDGPYKILQRSTVEGGDRQYKVDDALLVFIKHL